MSVLQMIVVEGVFTCSLRRDRE